MKPMSAQPVFAEATDEINKLNAALAKVQGRIVEIEALLNADAPDGDSSHVAAALEYAATGVVRGPDNTPTALREEHVVLRQQRDALRTVIGERHKARNKVASELSAQACKEAVPAHAALCKRYVKALRQLDQIESEERELIRSIEANEYSASFRVYAQWPYIGSISDRSSMLSQRVREMSFYEPYEANT